MLFVAGFSAVFTSYGALFGSLGSLLIEHQDTVVQVLGVLTILLGLVFSGVLWRVQVLSRIRPAYRPRRAGLHRQQRPLHRQPRPQRQGDRRGHRQQGGGLQERPADLRCSGGLQHAALRRTRLLLPIRPRERRARAGRARCIAIRQVLDEMSLYSVTVPTDGTPERVAQLWAQGFSSVIRLPLRKEPARSWLTGSPN
ncbi:MAG: cytochrome c biogenesis protein CcdA [Nocardioidaceae bacterium]